MAKVAVLHDDGTVRLYGFAEVETFKVEPGRMTFNVESFADSNGCFGNTFGGDRAKDRLADFFNLKVMKRGERIRKIDIRKGDLIRMIDNSEPNLGERDYKTLEYVATADGDAGYQHNRGEKFYLLERPKPVLPTAPGSVVKVRVPGYGVQHIVLGKDGLWRGPNVKAEASHVLNSADVVEVIA